MNRGNNLLARRFCDRFTPYLFILPLVAIIGGLVLVPFCRAIIMSLSQWRVAKTA